MLSPFSLSFFFFLCFSPPFSSSFSGFYKPKKCPAVQRSAW
jgi:hypothetical protein